MKVGGVGGIDAERGWGRAGETWVVTAALCDRWRPGVRLLPATDDRCETHVLVADAQDRDAQGRRAMHFQEWWVRHRAALPASAFVPVGADAAEPAAGVLEAIAGTDAVLLAPSNPVVSIGSVLAIPGMARRCPGWRSGKSRY